MIVMKFGGSSVGNAEMIKKVAGIVKSQIRSDPIVVVSALSGATDSLIELANSVASGKDTNGNLDALIRKHYDTIKELGLDPSIISAEIKQLGELVNGIHVVEDLTPKTLDSMVSFGERLSARIVAGCMQKTGINARAYDAYDIGMITDSNFGFADVLPEAYTRIRKSFSRKDCIPVVTGFIGKDRKGNITTLGRGGSDYTGSIIGAAVKADEIQIWTNVNGIMTADPRIVDGARNLGNISYDEESELEFLGPPTLHLKGILPAVEGNITVRILNTMQPEQRGTLITRDIKEERRVASITHKERMCIIKVNNPRLIFIKGAYRSVSEALQRHGISPELISVSKADVMILLNDVRNVKAAEAAEELKRLGEVEVVHGLTKVSIVGKAVATIPGIAQRMLAAVGDMPIEMIECKGSGMSQSFVVREEYAKDAIRALHKEFFGA
jgi:aspartate kinase